MFIFDSAKCTLEIKPFYYLFKTFGSNKTYLYYHRVIPNGIYPVTLSDVNVYYNPAQLQQQPRIPAY